MRLQYIAVVAAAALIAAGDGLQVVPNSASLRETADTRDQPYVEGQSDRFLISEANNETPTKVTTGYKSSAYPEEDDDDLLDDDDEDEEDEEDESDEDDEERKRKRRKRKKRKKSKETPTPTPTLAPNGTYSPTPAPTRRKKRRRSFGRWVWDNITD
ncbi:RxLR effector protein [Phytophthora megakarya]|uniref:RxLR effector protein n=1 Tax=Phytophthora megakarya TaxID=4795 RepID=A0A225W9Z5_9STRA|nr:RxLR effector protein [Phytophthora megakarya]